MRTVCVSSTWSWLCRAALAFAVGCAADLPQEPAPSFVELEFDPGAGKTSQPTSLAIDPDSGSIDLSRAGIDVPDEPGACVEQSALSVAQCELDQYLERLDGFPSLAPATTPASDAIDLSTATAGDNVVLYDLTQSQAVGDVNVGYDADSAQLVIDTEPGWQLGHSYLVGIRGYEHGIRSERGAPGCASIAYALLKGSRSLSCGATKAEQIDARCEYYPLFASDPRFVRLPAARRRLAIADNLLQLEQLRRYYRGETPASSTDLWGTLQDVADMDRDEVAIGWLFPVQTASVVELDPKRGLVPQIAGPDVIELAVKGTLDPATLSAFSLQNGAGTVFLLNVDVLQADPLDPRALPPFTASYADGQIVLTATDPDNGLVAGATYAVLLSDELTSEGGAPIVPSPVTVLLRSRGALVDEQGRSQVAGVSAADAAELEQGRARFAALLDDPMLQLATQSDARPNGLTRERIAYLFGFPFEAPP
jgi:hypothetical protein